MGLKKYRNKEGMRIQDYPAAEGHGKERLEGYTLLLLPDLIFATEVE